MLAAWGDSSDEEEGSEGEEEEEAVALMARSESDSDEESSDSLIELKNKVSSLNKQKLKEYLLILMDECDAFHTENCDLNKECDELKKVILQLKKESKLLKDEKLSLIWTTLFCLKILKEQKRFLS